MVKFSWLLSFIFLILTKKNSCHKPEHYFVNFSLHASTNMSSSTSPLWNLIQCSSAWMNVANLSRPHSILGERRWLCFVTFLIILMHFTRSYGFDSFAIAADRSATRTRYVTLCNAIKSWRKIWKWGGISLFPPICGLIRSWHVSVHSLSDNFG